MFVASAIVLLPRQQLSLVLSSRKIFCSDSHYLNIDTNVCVTCEITVSFVIFSLSVPVVCKHTNIKSLVKLAQKELRSSLLIIKVQNVLILKFSPI